MRTICLVLVVVGIAAASLGQNLDAVSVTDQFNTGNRGNATGSGTFGASKIDATEYADYTGADATGTPIRYINAYAGASTGDATNGESPVQTVTAVHKQPDYDSNTIPAIAANAQSGATGGDTAMIICDDGGYNGIVFGESDDANYYVQVDVYLWDQSAYPTAYEACGLGLRCARDNDTSVTDYTWAADRTGCYSIWYDAPLREIKCCKWTVGNSYQNVQTRAAGIYTQFGTTLTGVAAGWHRFRIEARDSHVVFTVDGVEQADIQDSTFTYGRPVLFSRENGIDTANERPAHFDNLMAGPTTLAAAEDWALLY